MPSLRLSLLLLPALTLSNPLPQSSPSAQQAAPKNCDRQTILALTNTYVLSQESGSLSPLSPYLVTAPSNVTYVENNVQKSLTDSLPAKRALKIDHRRTNVDIVDCKSYTELVVTNPQTPYVIGTQITFESVNANTTNTPKKRQDENNENSGKDDEIDLEAYKITKIDTIASTTGSWLFNSTLTLQHILSESWTSIPESQWDSREAIKSAGDAYLDIWSDATAASKVPWGIPCTRLEGSAYTGRGTPQDSCEVGIPTNHNQAPNTHRRYVIDQEMGSVSIFCVWEHMMNAADSHEFRLENGKLRYVHTMTECGGKTCRL